MADPIPYLLATIEGDDLPTPYTSTGADLWLEDNDGNVLIEITNPTAGDLECVFVAQRSVAGVALPSRTVTVPAISNRWFRPLPPFVYNDEDNNVVVQAAAGLQLRALRI